MAYLVQLLTQLKDVFLVGDMTFVSRHFRLANKQVLTISVALSLVVIFLQDWLELLSLPKEKMIQREQAEHQSKLMASRDRQCSEDTMWSFWTVTETL